jgi:hypothetical protein
MNETLNVVSASLHSVTATKNTVNASIRSVSAWKDSVRVLKDLVTALKRTVAALKEYGLLTLSIITGSLPVTSPKGQSLPAVAQGLCDGRQVRVESESANLFLLNTHSGSHTEFYSLSDSHSL